MARPTVALQADFTGGSSYATDLTAYVMGTGEQINIERGFGNDGSFSISDFQVRLNNRSEIFTRANTASSLYGAFWTDARIRVRVTVGATTYTRWTGYISDYEYLYDADTKTAYVLLTCRTLFSLLAEKEPTSLTYSTTRKVDDAITAVITAVGGSIGADGSTGADLPAHYNTGEDALTQCYSLALAELATFFNFFENVDGAARFLARWAVLGTTADHTWGDGTSIIPWAEHLSYWRDDRWSEARVRAAMGSNLGGTVVLFSLANTVPIAAGASYRFFAPFGFDVVPVPPTGISAQGSSSGAAWQPNPVSAVVSPVATTDYTSATLTMRTFDAVSNGAWVEMYNSTAGSLDLDFFQVRGTLRDLNTAGTPILTAEESVPAVIDSSRTYHIPWLEADQTTLRWAYAKMSQGRYEWPRLTLHFRWGPEAPSTATMDDSLAQLEIGDVVYYANSVAKSSLIDETWRVAGISESYTIAGLFRTEVTLVPSYLWQCVDNMVYDDFNRPNATGSLGKAPTGQTWTGVAGTAFDIVSGKARPNSTSVNAVYLELNDGDVDAWVKLANMSSDTNEEVGLLFRYSDSSNYWLAYLSDATNQLRLYKLEAGAATQVADFTWTVADTGEIRVIAQDTRIRVYLDGVLRIDTTSSFNKTATKHGFFGSGTTTVDFGPVYMAQI